jgi:hypothetical protein
METLQGTRSLYSVIILTAALLAAACKKEDHHPPQRQPCSVYQLIGNIDFDQDTITITYNNKGNPVEMNRAYIGTGRPRYVFRYDKHNRLTDLIGLYDHPTRYEVRFRFAYDFRNRISSDTQYVIGNLGDPDLPEYINEYTYDASNRIIQLRHRSLLSPDARWTSNYHYNQAGNLEKVTDEHGTEVFRFTYNDKVNVNSLHPLWQFLSRDYSRNNSDVVLAYNDKGLPTGLAQGTKFTSYFANLQFAQMKIIYHCR